MITVGLVPSGENFETFATNTSLRGEVRFCTGQHEHWRLRRCYCSTSRTKLAEPYSLPLCSILAAACCNKADWLSSSRKLNIVKCAKQSGPCIGEAMRPGPAEDDDADGPSRPHPGFRLRTYRPDCSCAAGCLRPCSDLASLDVHAEPMQAMNRSGDALLKNPIMVGFDIANAFVPCIDAFGNCNTGEHRACSAAVASLWFLGRNTLDAIFMKIARENPGRASLQSSPLTSPRLALGWKSVLEATVLYLNGSADALRMRDDLGEQEEMLDVLDACGRVVASISLSDDSPIRYVPHC